MNSHRGLRITAIDRKTGTARQVAVIVINLIVSKSARKVNRELGQSRKGDGQACTTALRIGVPTSLPGSCTG